MDPLILLRSHFYNEHVRASYDRLKENCGPEEPFLLLDTSKGDQSPDLPIIKFSGERLASIGIELYPKDRWAWFAGDYALYCAFFEQPDRSHYVMVDYDARINFSVTELLNKVESDRYDLVGAYAGFERDDWMWTAAGKHWFPRVAGCFFPVVVLSRRLIVRCLEYRLKQSRSLPKGDEEKLSFLRKNWMNCEAFVPSVALTADYKMMDIARLVPKWNYSYFKDVDLLYWDMPALNDVACAHPVFLKGDLPQLLKRRLREIPNVDLRAALVSRARSFKETDYALWQSLAEVNPELME